MKTKHTPGPWRIEGPFNNPRLKTKGVICADELRICEFAYPFMLNDEHDEIAANARRIVECVNACEGISDPSAIKRIIPILLRITDESVPLFASNRLKDLHKECRDLLTALTGVT